MEQTAVTPKTGRIIGLDMSAYLVADTERSIAFYRDVLGMTPTQHDGPEDPGCEFTLEDGTTFGVWSGSPEKKGTGTFFAVDDIEAAHAAMTARGARLSPVQETPVCKMAHGQDPDGNGFTIHQRNARD